jgi:uncharacterized coiled-coil DUF342 family protein
MESNSELQLSERYLQEEIEMRTEETKETIVKSRNAIDNHRRHIRELEFEIHDRESEIGQLTARMTLDEKILDYLHGLSSTDSKS